MTRLRSPKLRSLWIGILFLVAAPVLYAQQTDPVEALLESIEQLQTDPAALQEAIEHLSEEHRAEAERESARANLQRQLDEKLRRAESLKSELDRLTQALGEAKKQLDSGINTAEFENRKRLLDAVRVLAGTQAPLARLEQAFAARIQPIFAANCVECHGPDVQKSGLRLDTLEYLYKGGNGGAVIVAGDPDASRLVRAIRREGDLEMPPKKKLADADINLIAAWIDALPRAQDVATSTETEAERREKQWAFEPVKRPDAPEVNDKAWAASPIDAFILAKLEAANLKPSPPADRRALVRRLYYDLIGLPPTYDEVQSFIADTDPRAIEKLVDRLLASPRFGERWARHWLDIVRFAETHGFETNTPRNNAWPYRDYVIRAFNEDKPYTQFIKEQLAGDTMGIDEATGFLVAGPWDEVKSPDLVLTLQQRNDEYDGMISATSGAFLGLTVGCARCHDHKFDPISQKEYYQLQAVFSGVEHGERALRPDDYGERLAKAKEIEAEVADLREQLEEFEPIALPIPPPSEAIDPGGSGPNRPAAPVKIPLPRRPPVSPLMNAERFLPVEARYVRFTVLNTNSHEPCIDELEVFTAEKERGNVALAETGAKATASGTYPNSDIHKLEHLNDGKYGNGRSWISNEQGKGWVEIELAEPAIIDRIAWARDREGRFKDRLATEYKIEVALEPGDWKLVASSADRRRYSENAKRADRHSAVGLGPEKAEELLSLITVVEKREREIKLLTEMPRVYAGKFVKPRVTARLYRGDPMQPRERVAPSGIEAVGNNFALEQDATEADRRVALANWIANEKNPLTARVMVNRVWQYLMGEGIVATPSDFGANGARPTHPELLDWLASEFVANGWSVKQLIRQIVLTNTYQQSSAPRDEAIAIDAGNQLHWRHLPRRLEAEPIRDTILAVTGALDLKMGGPGYHVFEPNNNYVRVYTPKKVYGPAEWRRMIYQYKPRMEQDATFGIFDCPDAGQMMPRRTVSTTPLQALNLMNSHFVVQQAEHFAERLESESGAEPAGQARTAFRLAFNREAADAEVEAAAALIAEHGLVAFCRALFNANEFIYIQ